MNKEERLDILKKLITINSVNGNEVAVAQYLADLLAAYGIESQLDQFGDGRANLVAQIGQGKDERVLCFTGHQDTVAVSNAQKWEHPPFEAQISGDQLFGRGAADMKSGLAAEVITLIELVAEGKQPRGTVKFVATAGEEYGTPGAYRLDEQGITKDITAMVVGEPTGGQVVYAHSGSLNYEIKCYGKAAHSSTPEAGHNAINGLVEYINAEAHLFDKTPVDPFLGSVKHSVTLIKGGEQVNIIPDYASLFGNVRPTAEFSNAKVLALIKNKVDELNKKGDTQLEFRLLHNFYPVETSPENPFVKHALQLAQRNYAAGAACLSTINGATDASVFVRSNQAMAVIVLGPDNWQSAHQVDEHTTLSSFNATIETYKQLALDFFK
ncbi:ArgE/DapE family deacylase [Liquorilactobacillus satsumensis]|uniref:ArgE/DapE family deacylase n=1 Tax=Liquorilactobacillus satsumensis TaxID=259059 RepID=UPI001E5EED66|nr:ArgE/DapE family deacylase [Liquorilactobacillus satsumensis]MCC7667730.1 succinyl-diaminopimelate desuccinylase [Liquorilactobacillus satsumensis]MCP9357703.1 ArgE/DapE family deacylase [Liquorilactobacillus satsumensis]MCP9371443.1 ArgE/DapE family deacylase [Liquorilactobacillus satsumensis]